MSVSALLRVKVHARDGSGCHYCPAAADTLDHVVPRCVGGPTVVWNLVAACAGCNVAKGARRAVCGCPVCWEAEAHFAVVVIPARRRVELAERTARRREARRRAREEVVIRHVTA